jgi:CheY-like chemotaxis protein
VSSGFRVLIVEDEYFIADDLRKALETQNAEVAGPASNVEDAAALSRTSRIDLGILDINLSGDEVYSVADLLRGLGIPFVFATGYHALRLPDRFRDVPCFEKPFDYGSFTKALQDLKLLPAKS